MLRGAHEGLSKLFKAKGNYSKALFHHEQFKVWSDSSLKKDAKTKLSIINTSYEYKQQMKEIEAAYQQERANWQWGIALVSSIGILVLIMAIVFYSGKLRLTRANTKLAIAHRHARESHEEARQALEKLQKAQSKLIQAEKQTILNVVMASMAHEINNAMNSVKVGADVLPSLTDEMLEFFESYGQLSPKEKEQTYQEIIELKEDIRAFTREIQSGSDRTLEMLNTLKNFSRLGMEGTAYADLSKSCQSVIQVAQYLFMGRVSLTTNLSPGLPKVYCDLAKVNQLLLSLLLNAIEAIPEEGVVKVSTYRYSSEYIALSVSDSGSGVPEGAREMLFQPFYSTKQESNGLGLFLAKESMEEIGGRIFLDIEQSASTFVCLFPVFSKDAVQLIDSQ